MDPFTISAGISAIGGLFKGITGFFSGHAQAKALRAAAQQAGQESGVAAEQALATGNAQTAQAAVQSAANGGGFTGSALSVIQELSQQAMFNARAQAYRGATEVQRDLYDAKVAKKAATVGLIGSVFGAAGDLATGIAQGKLAARQTKALETIHGAADTLEDPPY